MSKQYTSQQEFEKKVAFETLTQKYATLLGEEMFTRFEDLSERGKALVLALREEQDKLIEKFRSQI
jgi:hypothetical protein